MIYQHYKGDFYRVLYDCVYESTNDAPKRVLVVYISLKTGLLRAREFGEFHEIIGYENGQAVHRFKLIGTVVPGSV